MTNTPKIDKLVDRIRQEGASELWTSTEIVNRTESGEIKNGIQDFHQLASNNLRKAKAPEGYTYNAAYINPNYLQSAPGRALCRVLSKNESTLFNAFHDAEILSTGQMPGRKFFKRRKDWCELSFLEKMFKSQRNFEKKRKREYAEEELEDLQPAKVEEYTTKFNSKGDAYFIQSKLTKPNSFRDSAGRPASVYVTLVTDKQLIDETLAQIKTDPSAYHAFAKALFPKKEFPKINEVILDRLEETLPLYHLDLGNDALKGASSYNPEGSIMENLQKLGQRLR